MTHTCRSIPATRHLATCQQQQQLSDKRQTWASCARFRCQWGCFHCELAPKCSQDIRRGVFHRLFRNHSVFFTVRYKNIFRVLFTQSYWPKALSFINIHRIWEQKQHKEQIFLDGDREWTIGMRASQEICHFQRNCYLISTSGASFHAN